jgi:hypothetical protein
MKPTILSYSWDITESDGVRNFTSTSPTPMLQLPTGIYDVSLTIQTSDGEYTTTESEFVVVSDYDTKQLNPYYLDNPKSYTYGDNNTSGFGWSENTGQYFVRPISSASITKKIINGETVTVIRDMIDKKQYIVNVAESGTHNAIYFDKDTHPIQSTIKTQKMSGALAMDLLQHEQTTVKFKDINDGADLPGNFEVTANIYEQRDGESLDSTILVNPDDEVTFYYQSRAEDTGHDRYFELITNTSQFQLFDIESVFKRVRKFRAASSSTQKYYDLLNTTTIHWFTRGDYERDLGTGKLLYYIDGITGDRDYLDLSNSTYIEGPDNRESSAIIYDQDVNIKNDIQLNSTLFLWSTQELTDMGGLSLTKIAIKNGWNLFYFAGTIPEEFTIESLSEIFDLRIFSFNLNSEEDKESIINEYVTNLERFLPTY